MKKRIMSIMLVCCLVVCLSAKCGSLSFADPIMLTASQVGAAALAVGSSLGIDWKVTGVGSGFIGNWIGTEVQRYDNGASLIQAVSQSISKDAAGKLAIMQTGYNSICEFIEWLSEKYTLENKLIGTNNIVFDPQNISGSLNGWAPYPGGSVNQNNYFLEGWSQNGARPGYAIVSAEYYNFSGLRVSFLTNFAEAYYEYADKTAGTIRTSKQTLYYNQVGITSRQVQNFQYPEQYALPTVLNPDKEWSGTIGEHSAPDTNLGDLLDGVLEDIEGGNLTVDGEIIDVAPVPTPHPTTPPAQDVLGGINELIGQQDQVIEGIDNLEQTVTDAAEAAQEAAEAIEEGLNVVTDQEASSYKFDLSTLFPFCIPFDIVRMLRAFDGIAEAPRVQIPFVIQSMNFSYLIDLDFSAFDSVAAVLRQVELIAFGIALAYATSKVIRW